MKGKILEVDIDENSAFLLDQEGEKLAFSLDDCVGFDEFPIAGEYVKYGINGGEIFFVEPLESSNSSIDNYALENNSYEEVVPREKKASKHLEFNIPLTLSLRACVDEYFKDISYHINEYEAYFEEYEELDYILMRRFLNTAYNNLSDMDSTFMDEELLGLRSDLNALDKIYTKLVRKDSIAAIAFENIFLDKQIVYKTNRKRMQSNSSEVFTLESSAKSLEQYIKDEEKIIENATLTKDSIAQKKEELKRHKTYYVDTLHKLANLKVENSKLKESLENFEKKYKEEFIFLFEEESKKKYAFIKRQLNGYAYVFDQKLWEKAEKSNAILSFFKKAHIEDEFSSKTFLKYFIKSLDETKMSSELKKLQELLWYLESRAKIRILLVEESVKERDGLKHIIRSLDKEFSVESTDKPRSVYYRKDLKDLDLIFVDYAINNPEVLEFLDMLNTRVKQTKSNAIIYVMSKQFSKEALIALKKRDIQNILALNVDTNDLKKNLKNIIDTLQT